MVYTERAETAAVSRAISHVTFLKRKKREKKGKKRGEKQQPGKLQSLIQNHMQQGRSELARERRIALRKSESTSSS